MILALSVTSCTKQTIKQNDDISILVDQLRDTDKFDTLLSIESNDKIYYFEPKTNEYVGEIDVEDKSGNVIIFMVFFMFLVGMVFGMNLN